MRLFGGWDLSSADRETGIARAGYARGVPMGGELLPESGKRGAPTFLVEALRDPREAPPERMQIVKAWIEDGHARERVYDVASEPRGASREAGSLTHRGCFDPQGRLTSLRAFFDLSGARPL